MLAKILAGVVVAFGVTGIGIYIAHSKPAGHTDAPRQARTFSISLAPTLPEVGPAGNPMVEEAPPKQKINCCDDGNCPEAGSVAK
jgi:hypothetical protein